MLIDRVPTVIDMVEDEAGRVGGIIYISCEHRIEVDNGNLKLHLRQRRWSEYAQGQHEK